MVSSSPSSLNPRPPQASRVVESPPLPGSLPPELKVDATDAEHEAETALPTLSKLADDFGWKLVTTIRDFRSTIEDIYEDHFQTLKRSEDLYHLQLSKLKAENIQMREKLGIQANGLFQNIQFQPKVDPNKDKNKKKVKGQEEQIWEEIQGGTAAAHLKDHHKEKEDSQRNRRLKDFDHDDDRGLLHRRRAPEVVPATGGGQWETFVAWVPAGAALQCPQPWNPLPHETFSMVGNNEVLTSLDDELDDDNVSEKHVGKWRTLEVWSISKDELAALRSSGENYKGVVPVGSLDRKNKVKLIDDQDDEGVQASRPKYAFILNPHSLRRITWDLTSFSLVMYDMVMIPMAFFDLGESFFLDLMEWTTRIFWTCDMPMSCITGVVCANGAIEYDLQCIWKRYLRTWFLLDTVIVSSDWLEFIISQGTGTASFADLARIFRVVRAIRLLRLLRMKAVLQALAERLQSEKLAFILNFVRLVVTLLCFAHVTACFWWGLGKRNSKSWASAYGFHDDDVPSQYLMSLHWTLSQFSGGMEEIRPRLTEERFFTVVLWIVSFMGAAIVASVLTASLVQLHIIGGSQARQLATLRKYLNQNTISKTLALRVQRSAKHAISGDLSPEAVDLLSVVSEQLRLEMHFEMYSDLFSCHPFFFQCTQLCAQVMRRICHLATQILLLDSGDVIFNKGESPAEPKMYFVFKGTLEYQTQSGENVSVCTGQWIAEPVLWVAWVHRGTAKALTAVKAAKLDARKFQEIMDRFKEVFPSGFNPKVYAADFTAMLNEMRVDQVTDLSNLQG